MQRRSGPTSPMVRGHARNSLRVHLCRVSALLRTRARRPVREPRRDRAVRHDAIRGSRTRACAVGASRYRDADGSSPAARRRPRLLHAPQVPRRGGLRARHVRRDPRRRDGGEGRLLLSRSHGHGSTRGAIRFRPRRLARGVRGVGANVALHRHRRADRRAARRVRGVARRRPQDGRAAGRGRGRALRLRADARAGSDAPSVEPARATGQNGDAPRRGSGDRGTRERDLRRPVGEGHARARRRERPRLGPRGRLAGREGSARGGGDARRGVRSSRGGARRLRLAPAAAHHCGGRRRRGVARGCGEGGRAERLGHSGLRRRNADRRDGAARGERLGRGDRRGPHRRRRTAREGRDPGRSDARST